MIRVDAGSVRATILSIRNAKVTERKAAKASVRVGGRIMFAAIRTTMGLTDHSLKDLAKMDHPYARRHGSIKLHSAARSSSRGPIISPPEHQVHIQSRELFRALKGETTTMGGAKGYGYRVSVDPAKAPQALYVIQGTKKMLPRDVLWSTANARGTRRMIMASIVKVLGEGLRAQAVVRFSTLQRSSTSEEV